MKQVFARHFLSTLVLLELQQAHGALESLFWGPQKGREKPSIPSCALKP